MRWMLWTLAVALSVICTPPARAQAAHPAPIVRFAGNDTTPSTGHGFELVGTVSRFKPATLTAGTIELTGGFWPAHPTTAPCTADCDASDSLDMFDFLCFTRAYSAGDPAADCDASGSLDLFDFLCFTNTFRTGCP